MAVLCIYNDAGNTAVRVEAVEPTSKALETTKESPIHEFVSDSVRATDTDIKEVREGMKKLGMQNANKGQ